MVALEYIGPFDPDFAFGAWGYGFAVGGHEEDCLIGEWWAAGAEGVVPCFLFGRLDWSETFRREENVLACALRGSFHLVRRLA